ncbi:MAG: 3'(2'),5'-bisphosphate nucleotidase CysQ [Psychrobium sp.]
MLMPNVLNELITITRQAGDKIMEFYRRGETQTWTKKDDSPITEADLAAHHIIVDGLAQLTPDIPVLSEESANITWGERKQWQRYWLVDPLDGTKEFIKRNGEFTVNIALIDNGTPIMATVYAPALDQMFWADKENGSYFSEGQQAPIKLDLTVTQPEAALRVVGSRSHPSAEMATFVEQFESHEIVPTGSSLKFCLVAQGRADIYPRLGPTMEWDTGAGHCIALLAGAVVTKLDGSELLYNQRDSLLNEFFVVSHPLIEWH